jgi:NADH-quinone oxidoreductase subunit G
MFRGETDTLGMIVMSCMTPAKDGMRLSIDDPEARAMRAGVIEFLMANHPHDCPVCDEGGECHLQDMTVMTGHVYRTHRFKKRTHRNQDLGPFVNHEMNRCIACYRCVRFYRDLAGGSDLGVFCSHDSVYFGRQTDGLLESELSGNLIEICPTGVFTDKTFKKHFTRKWDLTSAPSVCVHCGEGCNTFAEQHSGTLRRIRNRYNHEINGYFLCDRGRFGYEFVNSPLRVRAPFAQTQDNNSVESLDKSEALKCVADMLRSSKGIIGIGSPRGSLESNFALKTFVGPGRFFQGISAAQKLTVDAAMEVMKRVPVRCASLHDIRRADAVFIIGEDITSTAPMLAYSVRQSIGRRAFEMAGSLSIDAWNDGGVRDAFGREHNPLFVASASATKLDAIATLVFRAAPDDCARLGFAVAHILDGRSPAAISLAPDVDGLARHIAFSLRDARRPAVVSGAGYGNVSIIQAAANVARALSETKPEAMIHLAMPECNSLGLSCLGGGEIANAVDLLRGGKADTLLIVENDLFCSMGTETARLLLDNAKHVIAIDHLPSGATHVADIVFPAATFAESSGVLINSEGRAQRFSKAMSPEGDIQESWRWLRDIMEAGGNGVAIPWDNPIDILKALSESDLFFSGLGNIAAPSPPNPPYRAPGWNSVQALNKYQEQPGGKLLGGDPGIRLFERNNRDEGDFFKSAPNAFLPRKGELLVFPLYHVFGSEELSLCAQGIAQVSPKPYLAMGPADARQLDINEGELVEITGGFASYKLPAALHPGIPRGVAGMPFSVPGTRGIDLPQWFSIKKDVAP